jgi:hypothetical protein
MNKPDFYYASDYAGLTFKGGHFYYGYEHSICLECGNKNNGEFCEEHPDADRDWCFTATFDGIEDKIVIPHSKLGTKDMFDVIGSLNMGIGWVLAKYKLTIPEVEQE